MYKRYRNRQVNNYVMDSEAIASLPERYYSHPVTMVTSCKQVVAAIIRLLGHSHPAAVGPQDNQILGMDLEWKPSFDSATYNRTALIQLYSPGSAVIIRLNKLIDEAGDITKFVFPKLLKDLLENPHILKVGLNVMEDADRLFADFAIETQGCADIRDLPIHRLCQPRGLAGLAALFLGIRISKKEQTSNWEAPRLTAAQIRYAALDAYLSREIYLAMYQQCLNDNRAIRSW